MKVTQATNVKRKFRQLNPLIASRVLYLNWLAERRKEKMQQSLDRTRNNGKK